MDRLLEVTVLFQHDMESNLGARGLTVSRTHLLWVLHHAGPCKQHELAEALDVTPRNVTGLVDALVATGFVVREPHPTDRRATLVILSDKGAATMEAMAAEREQVADGLVAGMSAATVDRMTGDLEVVLLNLRTMISEAGRTPESP